MFEVRPERAAFRKDGEMKLKITFDVEVEMLMVTPLKYEVTGS